MAGKVRKIIGGESRYSIGVNGVFGELEGESDMGMIDGEMSRAELMKAVKLKDRVSFSKNYLEPALENGLIEMTQPDSPKSPTQKYKITEKRKGVKK